jgi:hypothetical protein
VRVVVVEAMRAEAFQKMKSDFNFIRRMLARRGKAVK